MESFNSSIFPDDYDPTRFLSAYTQKKRKINENGEGNEGDGEIKKERAELTLESVRQAVKSGDVSSR